MHRDIVFIADAFEEDIAGGGEINNSEVIQQLEARGYKVYCIHSHKVTPKFVKNNKHSFFILGNFVLMSPPSMREVTNTDYLIYEHDHKYLKSRNPAIYADYLAPKQEVINLELYRQAKAVLCQSKFHKDIVFKNTGLNNLISLGGNLWSNESLEHMSNLSRTQKCDRYSILDSGIRHKGTREACMFCQHKGYEFELVKDRDYFTFLSKLGANSNFVFFPQTPETLSRVVVEARMMGLKIISNDNIGATKEEWFRLKGEKLIDYMFEKKAEIMNTITGIIDNKLC